MLKYCTHQMRAFFPGIENPGKEGRGHVEQAAALAPALIAQWALLDKKKDLNFFSFPSLALIVLSPLAVVWFSEQLEAHRKFNFT